jgi:uncharacterized protein (DUF486 family)
MTVAWYSHLKFKQLPFFQNLGLIAIILISWGVALFEYFFQIPANRIGYTENGGPFNIWQLKIIQEGLNIAIFTCFTLIVFKNEELKWNHFVGFALLIAAVFFIFKK